MEKWKSGIWHIYSMCIYVYIVLYMPTSGAKKALGAVLGVLRPAITWLFVVEKLYAAGRKTSIVQSVTEL